MFTTWLNSLMTHHVTIVLCLSVSYRGSLQRNSSVIWLRPGAVRRAPGSPRVSLLHWISYLLSTALFKDPEQPRHPVVWLSGVHAVGNVIGSTPTNMSDMLTMSLSSLLLSPLCCLVLHCPRFTHHSILVVAVASCSVLKNCYYIL